MAKAYSCDRCGKLFKREHFADKVSVILENGNPFGICLGNASAYLSLCPTCRAGFQKWWDEEAVFKTTDKDGNCPPCVKTLYEVDEENKI